MKYTKPPLTFEEQADQLIKRGLIADRDTLVSRLKSVSYYRLSGYWHPFRISSADNFKDNTGIVISADKLFALQAANYILAQKDSF